MFLGRVDLSADAKIADMNRVETRGRTWSPAVPALIGWLLAAGALLAARPLFGSVSIVVWALAWTGWVGAVAGSGYAAVRCRSIRWRVAGVVSAASAVFALLAVGPPARSPEDLYRAHRAALDRLAGDYRAGHITGDRSLPARLRFLTVDGVAHPRCGSRTPPVNCGLFLLLDQDWRGESGAGMAYFPAPPAADRPIATAPGGVGVPVRELGGGWWLIA
jgi:hypothetical protein